MNDYDRNRWSVPADRGYSEQRPEYGHEERPVCRSTRMQVEEIEREREMSGWNPYAGEEEEDFTEDMLPYLRMPGQEDIMEEQKQAERDLRMLQSMFPEAAKLLLPHIEEECDRMEYEGSPMFDEYPDATTIYRIQGRIHDAVKDQFPPQPQAEQDVMLTMQYQGRRRNPPGRNWLEDLIRVMLLQEMHHRRCRHGRCGRPRRY